MPPGLIKKGIWAVATLAILAGVGMAALPWFASAQIVRNRIAQELSAWSGYRVEFIGAPQLELWPFRATLTSVTFSDWQDPSHQPVIETERIEVSLSALAALGGNAVLSNARLMRPIVHVTPSGGLIYAPDLPASGRITNSIAVAREAVEANPTEPDLSSLPDDAFGTVEFVDGQVVVARATGDQPVMTSLEGSMRWPALNSGAEFNARAIWRGESVSLTATLGQPLLLAGGGASPLRLSIKAAPINADFDGTANLSANSFFDGSISVSAPSLRRMLEWSASDVVATSASGSFSLSGHAIGDARRLKVENAEIGLDGNPGNGLLEFSFGEVPGVAGTLAFENLDLASFVYAFTPLTRGTPSEPVAINPASIDKLDLDLRLSAAHALVGPVTLDNVAATLQAKPDLMAFDVSDAAAFGGSVQMGFRYDRARDGFIDFSFHAADIDTAALAAFTQAKGILPTTGRATVSAMLKGPGRGWGSFLETAEGTVSASLGAGTIGGFNLAAFLERVGKGGFFPLSEVADGALPVERAELKAVVGNGLARLDKAEIDTPERKISFMGIVPHVGRGLALSGTISPKPAEGAPVPAPQAQFFVGGSWSAPFVSSVLAPVSGVLPPAD